MPASTRIVSAVLALALPGLAPLLFAGGPRAVAGSAFFNPAVTGQPLHWANGQVRYFVDQGPLNNSVNNQQATAMVDAAAALWSAVPTAGVTLIDEGTLNEDVSGANVVAGNQVFTGPADVTPSATGYPVGVVYDADGSAIDALFGAGVSDPSSCQVDGVMVWVDNYNPDATLSHAIILLNGLCATTAPLLEMMSFALQRAFGEVLGLGYSQVNPGALTDGIPGASQGWPVMQPLMGACGASGGVCIPEPSLLRFDDIAELNRLYPITGSNLVSFPGKVPTGPNTVSIDGSLAFLNGTGMQGVNVVARPLDSSGNPMYEYTVTFVSGSYFSGNHGNDVTGWSSRNQVPYAQWGSNDAALQGYFDLRYMPTPPGMTSATYQVTFETVNPLYIDNNVVGPYGNGSPLPSGTLNAITVPAISPGSSKTLAVTAADSAMGDNDDAISAEASPRLLPPSGLWRGRLRQVGQTDWFNFPVRGNRTFTVVTQALNEQQQPSSFKAMPAIGIWDAFDAVGGVAAGVAPGLNGSAVGETWLSVSTAGDDVVRLGIADMRGDGRPDYAYNGWVLYVDTVEPPRLPVAGGAIVIRGMGFRAADTVLVGGHAAQVTGISPNEITAIAPAATAGVTGSVDVEVDDLPIYNASAIISGGMSYDAGTGDSLNLVTAPANTVPIGVPMPFTVTALGSNLAPAGGVTVTYTVLSGSATLGCGQPACAVTASGDGIASMNVTAMNGTVSVVSASLLNGASLQAHFSGGPAPELAAVTPTLSLAAGSSIAWTTQAVVLNNGAPLPGQTVAWAAAAPFITTATASAVSGSTGVAAMTLTVGGLSEGQQAVSAACLNGTSQCVSFTVMGARPEYAYLEAVTGTQQSMAVSSNPSQIALRVRDMDGNLMAGATVSLFQAVYAWSPPCPPHGRCAQAELLATQSETATSGLDGTVNFSPATVPGVATNTVGTASTGDTSTLEILIEQHP